MSERLESEEDYRAALDARARYTEQFTEEDRAIEVATGEPSPLREHLDVLIADYERRHPR